MCEVINAITGGIFPFLSTPGGDTTQEKKARRSARRRKAGAGFQVSGAREKKKIGRGKGLW